MVIDFVNRPNGDFTFNGDTAAHRQRARRLPARPAGAVPPGDAEPAQDGDGWLYSAYVQDEFRPVPQRDAERRPALRAADAVRRDVNGALNVVPPGPAVDALPGRAARPGLSGRSGRAARHLRHRHEQPRAAARRGVGSDRHGRIEPARRLGHLLRRAAPARATSSRTACSRRRSRRCSRSTRRRPRSRSPIRSRRSAAAPVDFPPGLIFIGWGTGLPDAVRAALQPDAAAADRRRSRRRDRLRRIARLSPADLHGGQPGSLHAPARPTPGARLFPAFCAGAADVLGGAILVRLAPGQRCGCGRAHGINFLASYTYGHADRSRVRPEHRRRVSGRCCRSRSATRPRSTRRWRARRATRCSTCATASSSASAPSCRTPDEPAARSSRHVARRLAGQRHRPGADRLPARRRSIRHRHPLPDQPAGRDLRSRTRTRRTPSTSGSTPLLHPPRRPPTPARVRATRAANTVRGPGFARTDLSLFKNIDCPAGHRIQLRVEGFNLLQPGALRPARQPDRHADLRRDHHGRRRPDHPAGDQVPRSDHDKKEPRESAEIAEKTFSLRSLRSPRFLLVVAFTCPAGVNRPSAASQPPSA